MNYCPHFYYSPLTYPGGKRWILHELLNLIPDGTRKVIEPFFGGGVIGINLALRGLRVHGADTNVPITTFWKHYVKTPDAIFTTVFDLIRDYTREELIEQYDRIHTDDSLESASLFMLYSKLAWNGFIGKTHLYKEYKYCDELGIHVMDREDGRKERVIKPHVCAPVGSITFSSTSFEKTLSMFPEDLAICDPPYFESEHVYNLKQFPKRAGYPTFPHGELSDILRSRDSWILTYSDHPDVYELYPNYTIIKHVRNSSMFQPTNGKCSHVELIVLSDDVAESASVSEQLSLDL